MDEDSPEDVVHRLLAEALFPDHPLGRETAGSADDGRGHHARRRPRASSTAGTGPRRWWWPSPAPSTTTQVVAEVERGASPAPRAGDRRRSGRPRQADVRAAGRSTAAAPSRPTWRSASGAWPGATADREALDVVNHVPRRRHVEPAVRRDPRAAGAGLRGLLRHRRPTPTPGSLDHLRRHRPGPGRPRCSPDRRRAGEAASPTASTDDELDVAIGYLAGSYLLGLEDTGQPHGPPRRAAHHDRRRSARSTSSWPAGGPSPTTTCAG